MFIVVTFIEEILALHTLFSWWTSDRKYFERNRRIQLRGIVKRGHGWPSRWYERLWQFRGQSTEDCYDCVTYGFSTRIADGWFIQTSDGTSSKLVRYFIHLVTLLTVPQERALIFHFFYYSSLHREIARTIKRARVYLLRKISNSRGSRCTLLVKTKSWKSVSFDQFYFCRKFIISKLAAYLL